MRLRNIIIASLLFGLIGLGIFSLIKAGNNQRVDFNAEIRPILNSKCITCHGGVKRSGGFSLLFRSDAMEVNESGNVAIVPGHPDSSEMIARLTHHDPEFRMPLDMKPLSEKEIDLLTRWISQGAEWEEHWAYIKPEPQESPKVNAGWVNNDIDKFIFQRLKQEGLTPNDEADRATLIRRASLDLIGLPPIPEAVDAFVNNQDEDAYEQMIDELLASPRFGEKWASMWLDLARYADSKGYEKDAERFIWPYRDWVIKAFNEDLPFDQFTLEQIAGDMLPNPTRDQLIATGFHRNTMNNDEGGTDNEEFRVAAVIDRVNTTFDVFQGVSMSCVQCHSHPYDPFRQKEYYQLMAYFNNTEDADTPDEKPVLKGFSENQKQEIREIAEWIANNVEGEKPEESASLTELQKQIFYPKLYSGLCDECHKVEIRFAGSTQIAGYIEDGSYLRFNNINLDDVTGITFSYVSAGAGGNAYLYVDNMDGESVAQAPLINTGNWAEGDETKWKRVKRNLSQKFTGNHDIFVLLKGDTGAGICDFEGITLNKKKEFIAADSELGEELEKKRRELMAMKPVQTPIMRELKDSARRQTHVFERGNWLVQGAEVNPSIPASMPEIPEGATNDRLGFAKWLIDENNPLTSRVSVNRFWEQIFGIGIVETLEDFGTQGAEPTHPELLDWLALRFANELNWSVKSLLKEIAMSSAYRQSTEVSKKALEKDPYNKLLSRGARVRLSAEQIRDQALAVSGLLSDKMYGPSVMPPQPEGIWQAVYSSQAWATSKGEDRYRRGLYTYWRRTSPYPSMISFDSPSREFCVTRRIRTNTPLQALVTLNDPVYIEAAQHLASRMLDYGGADIEQCLKAGYKLAMTREPDEKTLGVLQELYEATFADYESAPEKVVEISGEGITSSAQLAALTVVANAIMNLDGFVMKG